MFSLPLKESNLVRIVPCQRYHQGEMRRALEELLEPFGGPAVLFERGKKVLLKPNLLAAAPPGRAVTTHPLVVETLAAMVRERGALALVGDSPGIEGQDRVHRLTGMTGAAHRSGARLVKFDKSEPRAVEIVPGLTLGLTSWLSQVDLVINLAKLKTHALTGLTAAVKNLYGCIPGLQKGKLHLEYPRPRDFARLLLGVCLSVGPTLSIVDAVVSMEGAGPRRGRPRQTGLLMASTSAVALDTTAAYLTGFAPGQVTTQAAAATLGLRETRMSFLNFSGLAPESCRLADFDRGPAAGGRLDRLVARLPAARIKDFLASRRPYPRFQADVCNSCGLCREHCPAQAIIADQGSVSLVPGACIRCYCCLEFCPRGAVST